MLRGESTGFGGIEGQAQLEEDVLESHDAEADRAPALVGACRLGNGIVVDVDDAIEHGHGACAQCAASLSKSKAPSVTWRARLMEPRLQTAVSSREVTSVISVQRFERWTTLPDLPV